MSAGQPRPSSFSNRSQFSHFSNDHNSERAGPKTFSQKDVIAPHLSSSKYLNTGIHTFSNWRLGCRHLTFSVGLYLSLLSFNSSTGEWSRNSLPTESSNIKLLYTSHKFTFHHPFAALIFDHDTLLKTMKFSILSSTLLASAMIQVQAQQKMRRASGIVGAGRDLEAFDGVSLSMSMPAELASVELFAAPTSSPAPSSDVILKSSKSAKTSVCDHRLDILFDKLKVIGIVDYDEGIINNLCHYQPEGLHPDLPSGPNFGCTLGYFPGAPEGSQWSKGKKEWWGSLPFSIDEQDAEVYSALEMYCECHVGIQDGCDAKIPREPGSKKWTEYCKGVAVWNGDALLEDSIAEITEEVKECGCYFIGQVQDKIDECPSVNLGEFFCEAVPEACPR